MSPVRVRFAPSPTGFFHIGSARTALFNWLYARHTGGVFILRIEDTDKERNSEEFLRLIYDSLTWLGMDWDEGPNRGGVGERGTFGPYRQSERAPIYQAYLDRLRAAGRTYEKDGATWFRLLGEHNEVYDDHRKKTVVKVKNAPAVIDDRIRGRVERTEDEDFVIVRSDGNPVFHFVNVVDDIAMQVTHVIRGEDHLSNTSKHIELFKAFQAPLPVYAHIPLILKQNGPGKMSKRDQGALIEEYQRRGYLPEALVNFLCLLGWNPGDDREKMPIAEIIRLFDLPGVNQSNARFDEKKLAHVNMAYLLEQPADRFVELSREFFSRRADDLEKHLNEKIAAGELLGALKDQAIAATTTNVKLMRDAWADPAYFREVMLLCQPKIKGLEELVPKDLSETFFYTVYFFTEDFRVDAKIQEKVMAKGDPKARLRELASALETADFSTDAAIEEVIKTLAAKNGLGFGDYQAVARLAVSGTNVGPGLAGMFRVLGQKRVLGRIQRFLATTEKAPGA